MNLEVLKQAETAFAAQHNSAPEVVSYAPGRVEILGNHTDYNEGYVLSCAIDSGTFFLASKTDTETVTLTAADVDETTSSPLANLQPSEQNKWANYIKGVIAGIKEMAPSATALNGLFLGDIPVGSGLSSSAALEISAALAVAKLWDIEIDPLDMARIGQKAEHDFAGANCGLLDQISSLYGVEDQLVMTDFRSLEVTTSPFSHDLVFLACNTHAKHALVDGAYNERRESCEAAAKFFSDQLPRDISALRDVSMADWQEHSNAMDKTHAMRSAHVIGENERVLKGIECLKNEDFETFGSLMYESHESSQNNFENSCKELDFIVDTTRKMPGILGARLSGGGFGGSVIVLVNKRDVETTGKALTSAYSSEFSNDCDVQVLKPSGGARIIR